MPVTARVHLFSYRRRIPFPVSTRFQLLSYTSDVPIASMSFSATADVDGSVSKPIGPRLPAKCPAQQAYLHVIDRSRTLRTWLLYPGGAIAIVAYSLPTPALRLPLPEDMLARDREHSSGPEFTDKLLSGDGRERVDTDMQTGWGESGGDGLRAGRGANGRGRRLLRTMVNQEETIDGNSLASGALVAVVIPGNLSEEAGPSFLVIAGVALTGIAFLPTGDVVSGGKGDRMIWEVLGKISKRSLDDAVGHEPRIFGMQALKAGASGLQALTVLWADRPSFQVLDVGDAGRATTMQNVPLNRMHRQVRRGGIVG